MKWKRVSAIARKESIQIIRDWRSLAFAIAVPFLLMLLFGLTLSLDVNNVPFILWDQSQTPESREFVSLFEGSRYFKHQYPDANNYKDIDRALDERTALLALVIPTDFARKLKRGRTVPVQVLIDGTDSNTATLALGYTDAIGLLFSEKVLTRYLWNLGRTSFKVPIQARNRVWFNETVESKNTIVPALIAVIMMVISALLTSLTIAREWERGTMEQLISTPVTVGEMVVGKLMPYFCIGMFDILVIIVLGETFFQVPIRGSVLLLIGLSIIFMIGSLSLGFVVSALSRSQLLASQLAILSTFLPSFLLSGFFTSLTNVPWAIQMISYLVPARYFITILRGIYLKGVGLENLMMESTLLLVYTVLMLTWACTALKKKID